MSPPSAKRSSAFDDFPAAEPPQPAQPAQRRSRSPARRRQRARQPAPQVERIERLKPSQMLPDRFQPRRLLPAHLRAAFFSGQAGLLPGGRRVAGAGQKRFRLRAPRSSACWRWASSFERARADQAHHRQLGPTCQTGAMSS